MTRDEYAAHDGLGLAGLVASGDATTADLLAAAVEPQLNSICRRMDDEAEARLEADLDGPVAGVPF